MPPNNRQLITATFTRLGVMWQEFRGYKIGYHLGFIGLIVIVAALDVALRLSLKVSSANPLQLALYSGFLGSAIALVVGYACLLIHVVGRVGDVRGRDSDVTKHIRTALLSTLIVVPATAAGLCCCVFPGVAVACLLAPVPCLVILQRYPLKAAVRRSLGMARQHPLTLLPVWLIVTTSLIGPWVLDGISILVVSTAVEPDLWLRGIGPAVRWLSSGAFALATIWALAAAVPVLDLN